jgi:thiol-disulfide isomerase/thioredoxin
MADPGPNPPSAIGHRSSRTFHPLSDGISMSGPADKSKSGVSWWWGLAALAVAWVVFLALFAPRPGSGDLAAPELKEPGGGRRAFYEWPLRDLDGKPVDFARYKGRVVFLNLWATWCGPCVAELPAIAHLSVNPRLKDVAFVCAATDDDPEVVRRFVRQQKLGGNLTILHSGSIVPRVFAADALPATYIIAPDGRIAVAEFGSAQWDAPEVVDKLEDLSKSSGGR